MNHYNDGGGHIESSNIYDEVASFDTIANAQTDMIFHYDEVVNFDTIANAQTDMIFHYGEVVNFDSMGDAKIDMISHPDEIAGFGAMPANQKDFFLSLFFRCFKTIIF